MHPALSMFKSRKFRKTVFVAAVASIVLGCIGTLYSPSAMFGTTAGIGYLLFAH